MAQPNEDPEYISELKKLVNSKVISEMTAQIHLSDINKSSIIAPTESMNRSQHFPQISPKKLRNRRIMFTILIISAAAVILLLIR